MESNAVSGWSDLSSEDQDRIGGLFLVPGRIVAAADGLTDEKETQAHADTVVKTAAMTASDFVKQGAILALTDTKRLLDLLIGSYASHLDLIRDCEPLVRRLPEADRNRLCNALVFIGTSIGLASGPLFGSNLSKDETMTTLVIVKLLGVDLRDVVEWVAQHGV